jgi:hypothetical protein
MDRLRVVIGNLQIYFEDGVARFRDQKDRTRTAASVEAELNEYQEFIERWLDKLEPPPRPRKLTPGEEELSGVVKGLIRTLRSAKIRKEMIIDALRAWKNVQGSATEEQAETIIEDAIAEL